MVLPSSWELPEKIRHRFGQRGAGRQRAMVHDGHLLLIMHEVPDPGTDERRTVFFWRRPDGSWSFSGRGNGLPMLREHIDAYEQAEAQLRREYHAAVGAEDYFQMLERLAPLQHASENLYRTLQAAREGIPDDRDIIDLRDAAYDVDRDLDLLYRDAKNALDFSMARKAEEQAGFGRQSVQAGHRLNILAALFFPLATLSTVFGMNMVHGWEDKPVAVFWIVSAFGLIAGLIICAWVLQRPRTD